MWDLQYVQWSDWGFCEWAEAKQVVSSPQHLLQSDTVIWLWTERGGAARERLLMGTDRTWKRNKARQKRNGGELDLMMRVLSAPLRNGFCLPCVCMCVWRGLMVEGLVGFFTCWSFPLCLKPFCPFVLSPHLPFVNRSCVTLSLSLYSIFPPVMPHSSFYSFSSIFPPLGDYLYNTGWCFSPVLLCLFCCSFALQWHWQPLTDSL